MRHRFTLISSLIAFSTLTGAQAYAACPGNVYSINGGRGEVGLLLDIQEDKQLTGYSNPGTRALLESRTLFSSSAMTYDPTTNRTYYASVTRPTAYYVEGVESVVSADELKSLSLHEKTSLPNQLAYYDHSTQTHTVLANVPEIFRMAFDPVSEQLVASDGDRIFSINPSDGVVTQLSTFSDGVKFGGFSSWGDFLFYDGELLFITNTRTFSVNPSSGEVSLKSFHYINFVTAATLDQNGQVIIAAKNQNVTSNINSTFLYRLNPDSGERVKIGLFPARINALATNTMEEHTCYDKTIFPSEKIVNVTGVGSDTVTEGETAKLTVNFDTSTKATKDINLALVDGTAIGGTDFEREVKVIFSDDTSVNITLNADGTVVTVPAGVSSLTVEITTIDDTEDEESKSASVSAWFKDDESDKANGSLTIEDNDEPLVPTVCTTDQRVQVRTSGAYVFVDCSNGRLGGPSISAQNITKRVNWSTNSYGGGNQSDWNTQIGVTEVGDLKSMSYYGSGSNSSNVCSNGGTSGTRINTTISGSIKLNANGDTVCQITLNETFCDGRGGLRYQNSSSSTCEYY
ncbi:hypothetical protein GCE9029_02633 [Grimontia celer]|uniref:Calx-beta domain protein n=1 Tax=Grimontia celer TaxID=1796497 RepID=A0A128F3Z3_9GAMM|nr:hypothetical protein [Grimontia celer]CZF81479.1 hypothetical protein GCE9029_02633 [Grimontia celer]